jgi:hypothetical protein
MIIINPYSMKRRSQWPHGLSRRSAATRLLGSRVWISLGAWMFVSCVYMLCCPVYVEASATGWSLIQRSTTMCLVCVITEGPRKGPCVPVGNERKTNKWMISMKQSCSWEVGIGRGEWGITAQVGKTAHHFYGIIWWLQQQSNHSTP